MNTCEEGEKNNEGRITRIIRDKISGNSQIWSGIRQILINATSEV